MNAPAAARKPRSRDRHKRHPRPIVAWDGEGANVDGVHSYIMLCNSRGESIESAAGLSTADCFEFLIQSDARVRTPRQAPIHSAFAFGYDVNMMLRDVPESLLLDLWQTNRCTWGDWEIVYRPRKEFVVRNSAGSFCRIWDTFGFFQCSFVTALRSWEVPGVDVDAIERMKAQRSEFRADMLPEIRAYCMTECRALESLTRQVIERSREAGVQLRRYDGPGAIASALLRANGVADAKGRAPEFTERAARAAYYGGRIECIQFGHTDAPVFAYDLRSAYPAALRYMPCLACGEWEWAQGEPVSADPEPFALLRVEWDLRGDVLPFPWRDPHGGVWYPRKGRGWYWWSEYAAALDARAWGVIDGVIRVTESYTFRPGCDERPFAWVESLYRQRETWKREGNAAERILKLGLNSLYGKTAQRVGGVGLAGPRWHQVEWAGAVTSTTRATLYRASFPAIERGAVVYYATDAILSTSPLFGLPLGTGLGDWELTLHESATVVQSGVYWLGDSVAHTRGFQRDELQRERVLDCWRRGVWSIAHDVTRFRGMGLAIAQKQGRWREWVTESRRLKLEPTGTKRDLPPGARLRHHNRIRPDQQLVRTVPGDTSPFFDRRGGIDSTPLAFPWATERAYNPAAYTAALDAADESEWCSE